MAPEVFFPPEDRQLWPEWREGLHEWRRKARTTYDGSAYRDRNLSWTASCYACAMLMCWDEWVYDSKQGRFRVPEVLRDGDSRFGGYDAVVLWHAYPRIGFDDRNQFDFYRELRGLQAGVQDFQKHGTRIFLDYNPWDTATRPEDHTQGLVDTVRSTGADGVFLDTLREGSESLTKALPATAFESELALPVEGIARHPLSWGQWFPENPVPGVLRNRWFERRHMMHMVRRWDRDHSGEIHDAWMNGAGMLVWENVFGSWNGWQDRDRESLRTMLPIQRAMHRFFTDSQWTPLVPCDAPGLFASEWRIGSQRLWTLVNRSERAVLGGPEAAIRPEERVFDLGRGTEPGRLSLEIPPRGIGCLYAAPAGEVDDSIRSLLQVQSSRTATRPIRPPRIREVPVPVVPGSAGDMVSIPGGRVRFKTQFRVRECGERGYAQLSDSAYPSLHQIVEDESETFLSSYAIDRREVTNGDYNRYLVAHGKPERGGDPSKPVTEVNLEDARNYATWVRKRLPTDVEWQYAAERGLIERAEQPVWEFTESERTDGHTRFCLLKGGSPYRAAGSDWYADGGVREPAFAAKFILISPELDRCSTIGFRCAVDLS